MCSAAFMFRPGKYDVEFHRRNESIDAAARATEGFLGTESWRSCDGNTLNATYYRESREALRKFSPDENHLEARQQYSRWCDGYHIVVSEVIRSYGDQMIPHLTANDRKERTTRPKSP